MDTKELKEKLHILIENSNDDRLEQVYSILEQMDYSEEFKAILDEEYNAYRSDATGDSRSDVDKLVNSLLRK